MCNIKTMIWVTDASGAMNPKNYMKGLNSIGSELKSTRASSSDISSYSKVWAEYCKKCHKCYIGFQGKI